MAIGATQKWYAGAAGASLMVLAAGWFLLVSPQKGSAEEINAQTTTVQNANQTTEAQIEQLKQQYTQLPQLESQVALIRTRIPQAPNEPTLLRSMAKAAKGAGVSLVSMQVQPPSVLAAGAGGAAAGTNTFALPGQVSQIGMTINITGTFTNTRLFLNSLESMQRVVLVTGLDITRGTDENGVTKLTTVITGRVFMANPGSPQVSVTSATSTAVTTTTSPS